MPTASLPDNQSINQQGHKQTWLNVSGTGTTLPTFIRRLQVGINGAVIKFIIPYPPPKTQRNTRSQQNKSKGK